MAEALLDIYDENLNHLGLMPRDEVHVVGAWHRTIHCWVVRRSGGGSVLFQKRGRRQTLFPGKLDITAAGHYEAGEQPKDGLREIQEELGLTISLSDLIPLGIRLDIAKFGGLVNREFNDVYLLERPESLVEYRLNPREVEGLFEIGVSEGLRLFSGEEKFARAGSVQWSEEHEAWQSSEMLLGIDDFVPRIDPYYFKVMIMAERFLAGARHLAI